MAEALSVLGIDGGGTRTRCVVADRNGRVLGEGTAGPSNCQAVGKELAAANVMAAAEQAVSVAGLRLFDIAAACAGLAGVGRAEDRALMEAALTFTPHTLLQVVTDARIALAGALGGRPGVIVISGTGSIAFGVDAAGNEVRAGGWGWILGDEGSGYDIGRRALAAALAAQAGVGPETRLGALICQAWGLEHLEQAVRRVYGDLAAARPQIAGLVPLVSLAARDGDAVASALLARAGQELAALAAAVVRRVNLPHPLVAGTGGVLTECPAVNTEMRRALGELTPSARWMASAGSPAEGAVRMALRLAAR